MLRPLKLINSTSTWALMAKDDDKLCLCKCNSKNM